MTRQEVDDRIAELTAISSGRTWTDREAEEFAQLQGVVARRRARLTGQIAACEAKLARLRAEQAVAA